MSDLRLVGGQEEPPRSDAGRIRIEIVVEIRDTRGEIILTQRSGGGPIVVMDRATAQSCVPENAVDLGPVARIDPATDTLKSHFDAFVVYLASRRKAESTQRRWRHILTTNARDAGWSSLDQLGGQAVPDFLAQHGLARGWRGTTTNAHLACWRAFFRWAHRRGVMPTNPLVDAESAVEIEHGEGARAPSTDEARALLGVSAAFEHADKRSKPRLAYFSCLFLAGCRFTEPARWLWSDLHLDAAIPFVVWRGEIQKNRRRAVIAIAPELLAVLRALPHAGDRVFPIVPSSATFRADRDRAGVAVSDDQGRTFSPHGARKWFSTTLTGLGVPPRTVDFLMRHTGSVESRYHQPSLEEQLEALRGLPLLLAQNSRRKVLTNNLRQNEEMCSPNGGLVGDTSGAQTLETPLNLTRNIPTPGPTPDKGSRLSNGSNGDSSDPGSACFAERSSDRPGSGRDSAAGNRGYTAGSATALLDAVKALTRAVEGLLAEERPREVQTVRPA